MNKDWTYKKLGEVCQRITDGSHNPPKGISSSDYLMISSQNVFNDNIIFDNVRYLSKDDFLKEDKRTRIKPNDVLLTIVGTIGRCAVVNENVGNITLQRSVAVLSPSPIIIPRYLMYCCIGNNDNLNKSAHGVAQRGIYLKQLEKITIPIPSIANQQQIVYELDLLSEVIEKRKAQIVELDKFAQSIFYDMFGDPVTNEKGWELRKLKELGELGRGVSKHRPRNAPELLGGSMPLIQTGDVSNSGMYITSYSSTYSEIGVAQSKVWQAGTLCITIAANIGNCAILTFDACFPDSVVGFIANENVALKEYVYYIFERMQSILEANAPAVAQKNINLKILDELLIPLPPLALQQEFAAKVEQIELMKAKVRQSLAEAETLFNSRMDYYFN